MVFKREISVLIFSAICVIILPSVFPVSVVRHLTRQTLIQSLASSPSERHGEWVSHIPHHHYPAHHQHWKDCNHSKSLENNETIANQENI